MSNYYITKPDGTQEGPYDKATLIALVKNHTYSANCYIWCEGMAAWKPFREVFHAKKKAAATSAIQHSPAPISMHGSYGNHSTSPKKSKGTLLGFIVGVTVAVGGCWLFFSSSLNSGAGSNNVQNEEESNKIAKGDNKKKKKKNTTKKADAATLAKAKEIYDAAVAYEFAGNEEEAFLSYQKAADMGHAASMRRIAEHYYYGKVVEQDTTKALEWCLMAAEQGDAEAQAFYGFCLEEGNGIEQNYKEAFEWYQKAADQGEVTAQHRLGMMYCTGKNDYNGFELRKDRAKARHLLQKAADQGYKPAIRDMQVWGL